MKRKIAAFFILMTIMLTACDKKTSAEPTETETTTEQPTAAVEVNEYTTIRTGVLLVGIRPATSPYITKDEIGKIEGFEVDIANAIGELTMLKVKYVEMEYSGIYSELDSGVFDCVISAAQINDATDKVYDFSIPYYTDEDGNKYAFVVKTGNNRLLNVLNKSIAMLTDNGTLDEIYDKWFNVKEEETEET